MLRAAVVGAGSMGQNHVRVLAQHPAIATVSVCDPDPSVRVNLAQRFPVATYHSLDALLSEGGLPDLAVVAVPTAHHLEAVGALLRNGVHCLVEKPIASTPEDGEALARLAQAAQRVLAVGHIERFNPAVRALRQLICDGALGDIRLVACQRSGPGPAPARRGDVNVLVDIGIHDVDVVNFLLAAEPIEIQAMGGSTQVGESEDYAVLSLDYGGAVAQLRADWITPVKIRQLEVVGTSAYAALEYVTQELRLYRAHDVRPPVDFSQFLLRFGSPDRGQRVEVEMAEPLRAELDGFIATVMTGAGEIVPPADAISALRVVTIATERIRHGRAA